MTEILRLVIIRQPQPCRDIITSFMEFYKKKMLIKYQALVSL